VQCTSGHCSASDPNPACARGSNCTKSGECTSGPDEAGVPSREGGCGCRSGKANSGSDGWLPLVLLSLLARGRRRRLTAGSIS
jgi:MYXO-CTERM domain-containing protein